MRIICQNPDCEIPTAVGLLCCMSCGTVYPKPAPCVGTMEDLIEALAILKSAFNRACAVDTACRFIMHAERHVDSQIEAYLRQGK